MRRAISTSAVRKALEMRGATREQIRQNNPGEAGENALKAIDDIEAAAEQKYGERAKIIKVQGATLHNSTKDPNEKLKVITVSIHTENGTRLESDHAREDGTSTQKVTRAGGGDK